MPSRLVAFALLLHATLLALQADPSAQTRTWTFTDLPPTLRSQADGTPTAPSATLVFPENFKPGHKYPLLLWIEGGAGTSGLGPVGGGKLVDPSKYFRLSVPLFLPELAPLAPDNSNKWKRLYLELRTAPFQAPIYSQMLDRVFADVPEIQRTGNIAGGFSNGAHILAVLLSFPVTAPVLTERFDTYLFIEGGRDLVPGPHLRPHRFLVLQGAKWEKPWLDHTVRYMREAKLDVEYRAMPEVGHAFPEPEHLWVAGWLREHHLLRTPERVLKARVRR